MKLSPQQFVAHRGYQRHYPENTLLSVRKALESGALHVEVDVQLSRDQVPIVYHDDTLIRMSAINGNVHEWDMARLSTCTAHEPGRFGNQFAAEKIATLAELVALIRLHPAAVFYIELKEEAVRNHGVDICLEQISQALAPVKTQCVLISFDLNALVKARQWNFDHMGPVLRDWGTRNQQIDLLQASVMFINKTRIPVADRITANCPVVVYEVDDKVEAQQLLQRGASKIETFAIGEMIR